MSTEQKSKESSKEEAEIAIEAFSQILEAMPNDRVALQALCDSYEQLGDQENALSHLIRLGDVIVDEQDAGAAASLMERLSALGEGDKKAIATTKKLAELMQGQAAQQETEANNSNSNKAKKRSGDIKAAMACAWNLLQGDELNDEEYAKVVDDLSESFSKIIAVPVTVLHVLTDQGATNIEKVMTFMARDCSIPIIPLKSFELQEEAYTQLPVEFMQSNAAIPFGVMGHDLLVAILDPYDKDLRGFVEEVTGRRCHYFLVTAHDYDLVLEELVKAEEEKQKAESAKV